MTNIYLEKIAEQSEKKTRPVAEAAGVLTGAALLRKVPQNLLGYHKVYHGTTAENAESILRTGFDPSKGGSNNALLNQRFTKNSQGKIHFTKTRLSAKLYAGDLAGNIAKERKKVNPSMLGAFIKSYKDHKAGKGRVVTARVPHSVWSRMAVDEDSAGDYPKNNAWVKEHVKERASTFGKKIDPKFIEGSDSYGGRKMFTGFKHLRRYLLSSSGRARALKGLAQLSAGVGIAGIAVKHNYDNGGISSRLPFSS